mgnify:CR=1 FL=1
MACKYPQTGTDSEQLTDVFFLLCLRTDWKTKYYSKYLEDYEKLGGSKDDFDKCVEIYEKHLRKSSVMCNIHTDGEGVSYNGVRESDEPCYYNYL